VRSVDLNLDFSGSPHANGTKTLQFDDLILRKVNESDASVFSKRYGGSSACWGVVWAFISLAFMACGIIVRLSVLPSSKDRLSNQMSFFEQAGLAAFKESFAEQASDSNEFLPTRMLMAMLI
jgi:hypothetical protein